MIIDILSNHACLGPYFFSKSTMSTMEIDRPFTDNLVHFFRVLANVVYDRDPRFIEVFWTNLWTILGSKAVVSLSYQP